MKIEIKKFFDEQFVELAMDTDNGTYLLGMPFDVGGAGHVSYYVISKSDFDNGMSSPAFLRALEKNGTFLGVGPLYYSSYVGFDKLKKCDL